MSYSTDAPPRKIGDAGVTNGASLWLYTSTHSHGTVSGSNFFESVAGYDGIGMKVGDILISACRTTTGSSAVTLHQVESLSTSTGWHSSRDATVTAAAST